MKKGFSFLVAIVLAAALGACDTAGLQTPSGGAPAAPTVSQLHGFPRQPICRSQFVCPV